MKRDWDLIREQLLTIEEGEDVKAITKALLKDMPTAAPDWKDGQTEAEFGAAMAEYGKREERIMGHLQLLLENGYIDGLVVKRSMSGDFVYAVSHPRLTMAGHDLLDTMRSKPLWDSIKSTAKSKGIELTFDAIKSLAGLALKALLS